MIEQLKGWQPLTQAARRHRVSRQWLSRMVKSGLVPKLLINGNYWVPDPLRLDIDRARQRRAKDNA